MSHRAWRGDRSHRRLRGRRRRLCRQAVQCARGDPAGAGADPAGRRLGTARPSVGFRFPRPPVLRGAL